MNNSPFWRGVFSESDGTPSSSRILMFAVAAFVVAALTMVFRRVTRVSDVGLLTLWLAALPILIGSLIGLVVVAPYGIGKAAGTIAAIGRKESAPTS